MGTEIGYLQNKIRELQEEQEDLRKQVQLSLEREKRFTDFLAETVRIGIDNQINKNKILINEVIENEYKHYFKNTFDNFYEQMNSNFKIMAKSNKELLNKYIAEIMLSRKDLAWVTSLVVNHLGIDSEELLLLGRQFDKKWSEKLNELKNELNNQLNPIFKTIKND
jgi:hypothetical protein